MSLLYNHEIERCLIDFTSDNRLKLLDIYYHWHWDKSRRRYVESDADYDKIKDIFEFERDSQLHIVDSKYVKIKDRFKEFKNRLKNTSTRRESFEFEHVQTKMTAKFFTRNRITNNQRDRFKDNWVRDEVRDEFTINDASSDTITNKRCKAHVSSIKIKQATKDKKKTEKVKKQIECE